ncbi:MAG: bifunctional metallophosphatase/5'-nucleotidase [Planctomycetota bacterium]|nr:bifunctional metallophosphatase/5'-nucleotidase [Planctomycetota bacterium]
MRSLVALLALLAAAPAAWGEDATIVVLHTNDIHGQLRPLPASPSRAVLRGQPAGGFIHLALMVRGEREAARRMNASVLLLDAGDLFQGTPVGNETRGDAVIDVMNALGYDAAALGNHEFDYGVRNLVRLAKRARFPILCANASRVEGTLAPVVASTTVARAGLTIALIGVITPDTPQVTTPDLTGKVRFSDPVPAVKALVKETEADLFIVVSHLGTAGELRLAREVPQLTLIVGGHSHAPLQRKIGSVTIARTHARTLSLGRVAIDVDKTTKRVRRVAARLLPVDAMMPYDPAIAAIADRHRAVLDKALKKVVGRLAAPARRRGGLFSSAAGNWTSDVIRRAGKAAIGIMNKGGLRADLEAGAVRASDCYRLMPFDNTIVSMDLTGAGVRKLIEKHLSSGGYPALEWSGMRVFVTRSDQAWRIDKIEVGGEPLAADKTYRVATNSFLARGGDGYATFQNGKKRGKTGTLLRDALAADLEARSPLTPPTEERLALSVPAR